MLLLGAVAYLTSAGVALASGIAAWLGVTFLFLATAAAANARIAILASRAFPSVQLLDRVLTPLPANPICREVIIVQTEGDRYVLRKAMHSLAPGWMPVSGCPLQGAAGQSTARLAPSVATDNSEIAWQGEIVMPRVQLAALAAEYCAVRALLRFARAPWVVRDGPGWIVGDLRFDRGPGLGFAAVRVSPSQDECPTLMPAWLPPRSDLLR
jgi:inner membrane protein